MRNLKIKTILATTFALSLALPAWAEDPAVQAAKQQLQADKAAAKQAKAKVAADKEALHAAKDASKAKKKAAKAK